MRFFFLLTISVTQLAIPTNGWVDFSLQGEPLGPSLVGDCLPTLHNGIFLLSRRRYVWYISWILANGLCGTYAAGKSPAYLSAQRCMRNHTSHSGSRSVASSFAERCMRNYPCPPRSPELSQSLQTCFVKIVELSSHGCGIKQRVLHFGSQAQHRCTYSTSPQHLFHLSPASVPPLPSICPTSPQHLAVLARLSPATFPSLPSSCSNSPEPETCAMRNLCGTYAELHWMYSLLRRANLSNELSRKCRESNTFAPPCL